MRKILLLLSLLWCVFGCWEGRQQVKETNKMPEMVPDYQEVTIPVNIAPLNFKIEGADRVEVEFRNGKTLLLACRGKGAIDIPLKKWHSMLREREGESLDVKVFARQNDGWVGYRPFRIYVVSDSIDPYLAYRLIEPGYELGKRLGLYQRNLSSFEEKVFLPPALTENSCVNCHSFCNYSPDRFMFHVRWDHSGTILVEPGKIQKINTGTAAVITPGAYRMWHPSGCYIAFSNNQTSQAFHALQEKKIEVYDLESDLMIYDVVHNKVLTDKRFTSKELWETFPAWSPDGQWLYFCRARGKDMPREYKDLKYGIYRVAFDEQTGLMGDTIQPVVVSQDTSVIQPVVSPDGRYLLYTVADCGTFPVWHKEADLNMLDLKTGKPVDIRSINSDATDSYHSWSSSGRWVVVSSRRMDHLYTRVYFAYFDRDGRMHKPFILPQRDPCFYTLFLKSYNIPEFIKGPVTVSPYSLEAAMQGEVRDAI